MSEIEARPRGVEETRSSLTAGVVVMMVEVVGLVVVVVEVVIFEGGERGKGVSGKECWEAGDLPR